MLKYREDEYLHIFLYFIKLYKKADKEMYENKKAFKAKFGSYR